MNRYTENRIRELEQLDAGWLDGAGEAVHPDAAYRTRQIASALGYAPCVYPTPDGGLQMEWGGIVEIEIKPDGGFHVLLIDKVLEDKENDD